MRYVIGNEAVNWMRQNLGVSSREEALVIGRELWEHGFITGEVAFTDSQARYYFLVIIPIPFTIC